jgi:hypothetical protein
VVLAPEPAGGARDLGQARHQIALLTTPFSPLTPLLCAHGASTNKAKHGSPKTSGANLGYGYGNKCFAKLPCRFSYLCWNLTRSESLFALIAAALAQNGKAEPQICASA